MHEVNEAGSVTADYVISPFNGSSRVDVIVAINIVVAILVSTCAHMPIEAKAREWRLVETAQRVPSRRLSSQCDQREFHKIFLPLLQIP